MVIDELCKFEYTKLRVYVCKDRYNVSVTFFVNIINHSGDVSYTCNTAMVMKKRGK